MPTMRRSITLGTVLGLAILLPACAGPDAFEPLACPAVGWIDSLTVHVDPPAAEVAVCTDDGCVPSADAASAGLETVMRTGGDGTWNFSGHFPDGFTLRAIAADGTVLSDTVASPQWVRTGGSEECGGPRSATVTLVA